MSDLLNAFTVDVEDYFQVSAFEGTIARSQWPGFTSRVVANTHRILALLERHGVRATFFVLGWVGERHGHLVRDIAGAGHEVGCHGYWHRLVYEQTPDGFRDDIRQARDILAGITGREVTAYRAPSFSITRASLWAYEILAEEGFRVDSSVFPTRHDRYGIPDAKPDIHVVETAAGRVVEFPPSVLRIGGRNVPVAGGGYFRLYPYPITRYAVGRVQGRRGAPFMFYVHPWEVDPEQPRLRAGTLVGRMRHYVNLPRTQAKLDRLLTDFRFGSVSQVLDARGVQR